MPMLNMVPMLNMQDKLPVHCLCGKGCYSYIVTLHHLQLLSRHNVSEKYTSTAGSRGQNIASQHCSQYWLLVAPQSVDKLPTGAAQSH